MASFPGGSAWAMVRDIADGYYLLTERSFRAFNRAELDKIQFELDRRLRDLRGEQPALDDLQAIQLRNRRLQRLSTGSMMLSSYRVRMKL
jgi:hypothetical protein